VVRPVPVIEKLEEVMEHAPVIQLTSRSPAPGADVAVYERYVNWGNEVYIPLRMRIPEMTGVDAYQLVGENPGYGIRVTVDHHKNLVDLKAVQASSEMKAILGDLTSWTERGITDQMWAVAYSLIKSFRSQPVQSSDNQDTRIDGAAIMHLEAFRLSAAELGKYLKWLEDFGRPIFMPLFMKLPGLIGYDWYKDTGLRGSQDGERWEYPECLSIIYFETLKDYDNFVKSPELAGFQKAIRSIIPYRLGYIWNVQYQLVKSWRK
jgi:hypothetical protein